jgi:hypothetical protein
VLAPPGDPDRRALVAKCLAERVDRLFSMSGPRVSFDRDEFRVCVECSTIEDVDEAVGIVAGESWTGWLGGGYPDTDWNVIARMEDLGGSFVQALAAAWRKADLDNDRRLHAAFAEIYDRYSRMGADGEEDAGDVCSSCGKPIEHKEPNTDCDACRSGEPSDREEVAP